jgi:hypothetical protein
MGGRGGREREREKVKYHILLLICEFRPNMMTTIAIIVGYERKTGTVGVEGRTSGRGKGKGGKEATGV